MLNRNEILDELMTLSPALAAIEKVNVFSVPEGYFETFPILMLDICKAEESSILAAIPKTNNDIVPGGYFESLADNIMAKIKAAENVSVADELKELSPTLSGIQHKNVFEVPAGYFDNFADSIMSKIKAVEATDQSAPEELRTLSPILYSIQNKNVFEVPAGYFDGVVDSIMSRIKVAESTGQTASEELRALSPMLYSIQNENVFSVPKGYFESLSDEILDKVQPPKTRVVPMRRKVSTFMKYAVAAMFTGVMAFSVFKFMGHSSSTLPGGDPTKVNVDAELAKISDDDIVKYLESSGTDVKTALVASSVDDHELPSQEDYLLDDKALDNYLNSINVNDLKN